MTAISSTREVDAQEPPPGTWGAVILAGLPHLLMGLLIGVGKLMDPTILISQNISLALGISLGLFVVAILLIAWRDGWPLWSASWYFYGTWVTFMVIGLIIENLNLKDSWRYTNALFIGWILLCIVGYFLLLSQSKLHGLLSVAFLFPFLSLTILEFIPNPIETWFAIGVGVMAVFAAGIIVRIRGFRPSLLLVLGFNFAVGLVWAYINEYKLDLPDGRPTHIPSFSNFLEILGFYSILISLGVIAIPFILSGLWNFGRNKLISRTS